ncbi:PREDICTED: non-specific lipid-transfer protein-like protein At2g13820 [Tarenaya hassleriana]|uniref:non-specific lipid-transfer protein-like protein At2g13820 n=1 Tax=Tarenaya hassleriana TaxID=28532 RepID=UPI00053C4995|nr:PREDICTED: non-specific lipid-transfer protein-like protein At2g13820 [Tarenaya hassleriana]
MMGSRGFGSVLAIVVIAGVLSGGVRGQGNGCTTSLASLAPCLTYITGNSTAPSQTCCSQLAGVVRSYPQCLCSVVNGPIPNIGININQTLALQLPGACNVQTPPLSQCNAAANGPTASTPPAESPAEEMPGAAAAPTSSPEVPSGSGGRSKTVPSTGAAGAGSSAGNVAAVPLNLLLLALSLVVLTKF